MASKCWFVLKQTDYPPPTLPSNGVGQSTGPICLGHLIPGLKDLDRVINRRTGPLPIPPDMPVHFTAAVNFSWKSSRGRQTELSTNAGVPIAAAAGLTVNLDAGVSFQRTIKNFWEFESLETWIIQPSGEYVEDSMEEEEVAAFLKGRGPLRSSSVFMITGIKVARGARTGMEDSRQKGVTAAPGV